MAARATTAAEKVRRSIVIVVLPSVGKIKCKPHDERVSSQCILNCASWKLNVTDKQPVEPGATKLLDKGESVDCATATRAGALAIKQPMLATSEANSAELIAFAACRLQRGAFMGRERGLGYLLLHELGASHPFGLTWKMMTQRT